MEKNKLITFLLFLYLSVVSIDVGAQNIKRNLKNNNINNNNRGTWRVLGTTHASHGADHDAIQVTGNHDYYRKLKIKVTDSPLNIQKMVVRYDDGAPENIDIRQEIPKNGESRIIDLRGGKRKLKSIEFWYDTKGFLNGKADVTVFGMK